MTSLGGLGTLGVGARNSPAAPGALHEAGTQIMLAVELLRLPAPCFSFP